MRAAFADSVVMMALGLLAGCDHSAAFGPEASALGLLPSQPDRMTYSGRLDRLGGFSSTGTELFYTYCEDSKAEASPPCGLSPIHPTGSTEFGDRCLGALPSVGGARTLEFCGPLVLDRDTLNRIVAGARLANGALVYVYAPRRPTASFSIEPALYLWRPGAQQPIRLREYLPGVDDHKVPTQLLATGPHQLVTLGGEYDELVTVADDNTATFHDIPRVLAVDPTTPNGLRLNLDRIEIVDLSNAATQDLGALPLDSEWTDSTVVGIGLSGTSVLLAQYREYEVDDEIRSQSRLVLLRNDALPLEIERRDGQQYGPIALSPDGMTAVIQRGGDLYRYALP